MTITAGAALVVPASPEAGKMLLMIGAALAVAAVWFWWREWLAGCHRAIRDGAGMLWPVVADAFQRLTEAEEADRAALRPIAQDAAPPTASTPDATLKDLSDRIYPRRGASGFVDDSDRERIEAARVMIRDAVDSLGGNKARAFLSGGYVKKHMSLGHRGTLMLYWYLESALAHQIGWNKLVDYRAVERVYRSTKASQLVQHT